MFITRRKILKGALVAAAVLALPAFLVTWNAGPAHAFYQSPGIPLFGTTLRGIDVIPVAAPDATPAPVTGVTHYTIDISQFEDQITPNLGPTTLWGYQPTRILQPGLVDQKHLGGIIVAEKGNPIQITFQNMLPSSNAWGQIHPLPVDTTIPGADLAQNRVATHLHGGLVPWISDGGPFDWFDPSGNPGISFLNNEVLNPGAGPGQAEYYYPLNQSARFLWYHDHAVGITRLNAQIGIASGMLVRDAFERGLISLGLPDFIEKGGNEIPIVIQDKIFQGGNIKGADKTWTGATGAGNLWYAHTYDPNRWELVTGPSGPPPDPSSIPEYFGDTMLVNGTTYPEVTVQARRYRLRLLNACNARFVNLQLYVDDGTKNGITLNATTGNPSNAAFNNAATSDASWLQIGTEGGFLSKPAKIPSNVPIAFDDPNSPFPTASSLIVAPAERPDVIVDFSGYAGKNVILYNDAPAPFPGGDPVNDYFPGLSNGNPVNRTTAPGRGPNTRVLMRFNVVALPPGDSDLPLSVDTSTDLTGGLDPFLIPPGSQQVPKSVQRRFLTLNEYHDEFGRLIQILGNAAAPFGSPYFGTAIYADYPRQSTPAPVGATEERVKNGRVEAWEIYNTTGDVHPMHFHLVNVQIINRQLFDMTVFPGTINFTGPTIAPEDNELGWKETVPMYPGTVTRVIMKFDLSQAQIKTARGKVIKTPVSPRTGGFEYVWHCHILEHEEHDMMHALVVE